MRAAAPAPSPLDWAARAMGGAIIRPGRAAHFAGATIDSRAVAPGQLFFAFPGERVDGLDFAARRGAPARPAWSWRARAACRPAATASR